MSVHTFVVPSPIDSSIGTVELEGSTFRCRCHVDSPICHECCVDGVILNDANVISNVFKDAMQEQIHNIWDAEDAHFLFHGAWPSTGHLQELPILRIAFDSLLTEAKEKFVAKLFSAELSATCISIGSDGAITDCFAGLQGGYLGTTFGDRMPGEKPREPKEDTTSKSPKGATPTLHGSTQIFAARQLHVSEVPRNSLRFCIKNVTIIPLESNDVFEKLAKNVIESRTPASTLIFSVYLSQVCAIAKPRSSRGQFFFFSSKPPSPQTIEVFSSFSSRQPPVRSALNSAVNQLLASCVTAKPVSNIVVFEYLDHSKAIQSLNVLASVKAVGVATLLDRATPDVIQVNSTFETERQTLQQRANQLTAEMAESHVTEAAQAHTIAELSSVANFGAASTFSPVKTPLVRKDDQQSSDDEDRDSLSGSSTSECAELREQIASKEDEILQYELEAEKNRIGLASEVTDAEEAWKGVSNRAMELRKLIDKLKTEIANRQYSSACAQVAMEQTFHNEIDVLIRSRHAESLELTPLPPLQSPPQQPQLQPQQSQGKCVGTMHRCKSLAARKREVMKAAQNECETAHRRYAVSTSMNPANVTPTLKELYDRRRTEVLEKIRDEKQGIKRLRAQLDVERSKSASVLHSYNMWFAALCEFTLRTSDVLQCYRLNNSVFQHFYEWLEEIPGFPQPRLMNRAWDEVLRQASSELDDRRSSQHRLLSFMEYPASSGPVKTVTTSEGCMTDSTLKPPVVTTHPDWVPPDKSRGLKLRDELLKFRSLTAEVLP